MAKHIYIWLGLVMLIALAGCTSPGMTPTRSPGLEALDAIIERGIKQRRYPGAVCVIGRVEGASHQLLWAQAYGRLSYEPDSPAVTLDTAYDLASVTKLVGTTTATLLLIQTDKLELDDPAADYVDAFSAHDNQQAITLRHLLTHTSGFQAYVQPEIVEAARDPGDSASEALMRHYGGLDLAYPTGQGCTYSCLNFQTLARVNETVLPDGQTMEAYLQKKVFGPLGMTYTTWQPGANRASGKDRVEQIAPTFRVEGVPQAGVVHDPLARYHGSRDATPGNAGLFSTGPDLSRWCRMVLAGGRWRGRRILDEQLLAQATLMQTPAQVSDGRGLGFDVFEVEAYVTPANRTPGHYVVGHFGYTGTLLVLDQHTGVYMILLTNRTLPAEAHLTDQSPSLSDIRSACWQAARQGAQRP